MDINVSKEDISNVLVCVKPTFQPLFYGYDSYDHE